jgi:hypothetical protein
MSTDNLLGAAVRIRRGWHGGRTGKVTVFEQHGNVPSTYTVIKVRLDGSGQVVNINSVEEVEKLTASPTTQAV